MPRPTREFAQRREGQTPDFRPGVGAPVIEPARDLVFRRIAHQAGRFPMLELTTLDSTGLEPRDAALAHAIEDAVVRRWLTLSYILSKYLTQPISEIQPTLLAALLGGSAQLLLLDRVPAYAAINHAVEWAKVNVRFGAGGMVNAVLRKVAELRGDADDAARRLPAYTGAANELPLASGEALLLSTPIFPVDDNIRIFPATGVPRTLVDSWSQSMPLAEARRLALHSITHAPVIFNTAHAKEKLDEKHFAPHSQRGHHVFTGTHSDLLYTVSSRQDIWVQDPASSLSVEAAAHLKPGLIVDLCAGQGTKTRQLAATFPNAKIIATDTDPHRRTILRDTFDGIEQVTVMDPREMLINFAGRADLALLDVPCSNTGVLARRPEAKYRFQESTVADLVGTQRQILADSIPFLLDKPPGAILYATCSLEPRENESHVPWAKQWHQFEVLKPARRLPAGGPGRAAAEYTDGSFAMLLGRRLG